jgi:hypothetical protein
MALYPTRQKSSEKFLASMDNKSSSKEQQNAGLSMMFSPVLVWPDSSAKVSLREIKQKFIQIVISRWNPSQIQYREIVHTRTRTMNAVFIHVAAVTNWKSFGCFFI